MKFLLTYIAGSVLASLSLAARADTSLFKRKHVDTTQQTAMNMDAVYNRPFLQMGTMPVSMGGYVEANYRYEGEQGVSTGHSFQMQRLTLFFAAAIDPRIRFLTEIEFEGGGSEIAIEFASVDVTLADLCVLRGGILMNPIGAFNQNHDGPKWEFVDRPVSMTQMLPATWSNVGFGAYGKTFADDWSIGYEAYLTNGFDESIIDNDLGRTSLAATKEQSARFLGSSNGHPLLSAKVATRHQRVGEIGLSYMGGVYNQTTAEGVTIDQARRVDVVDVDVNVGIPSLDTRIIGEWAWVFVDVPSTYSQQYGSKQMGGYVDVVQPIYRGAIFGFDKAVVNLSVRADYVDWNVGTFNETGDAIGDEMWAITAGVSFRPVAQTVLRINARTGRSTDLLGNPPARSGGILVGFATYF